MQQIYVKYASVLRFTYTSTFISVTEHGMLCGSSGAVYCYLKNIHIIHQLCQKLLAPPIIHILSVWVNSSKGCFFGYLLRVRRTFSGNVLYNVHDGRIRKLGISNLIFTYLWQEENGRYQPKLGKLSII
jgi:hypothetical protein